MPVGSTSAVVPTSMLPTISTPTYDASETSTTCFNATAQSNVAVYWGASPATSTDALLTLCQSSNVNIVILAFLGTYFGPQGYPALKIGGGSCQAATPEQQATAPGLVNCTSIAPTIAQCQRSGKPVLLSLGGSTSSSFFDSAEQATEFASTLWSLFGADTANITTLPIRPFGPDIVLDGFDLDPEDDKPEYYGAFVQALRAKYSTDPTKPYYISGSPHCPIPDTSLPLDAMLLFDWVWPRFYNAKSCNADGKGFMRSVANWSKQLANSHTRAPRLYPGIAVSNLTGNGSLMGSHLHKHISGFDLAKIRNFGGLMLWDGSLALVEDAKGIDYLDYARQALIALNEAVSMSRPPFVNLH